MPLVPKRGPQSARAGLTLLLALACTPRAAPSPPALEPAWQRLSWPEAYATSNLGARFNSLWGHPIFAVDGDPATAWIEGASSIGVGETLTVPFVPPTGARALRVAVVPECPADPKLYRDRPARLRITLGRRGQPLGVGLPIEVPEDAPRVEVVLAVDPADPPDEARVTIEAVHPSPNDPLPGVPDDVRADLYAHGASPPPGFTAMGRSDTCIAEVEVDADAPPGTIPDRAAVDRAVRGALLDYLAEVGTANNDEFSLPPAWPVASYLWIPTQEGSWSRMEAEAVLQTARDSLARAGTCPAATPAGDWVDWEYSQYHFDWIHPPMLVPGVLTWEPVAGSAPYAVCRDEAGKITRVRLRNRFGAALSEVGPDGRATRFFVDEGTTQQYLEVLHWDDRGRLAGLRSLRLTERPMGGGEPEKRYDWKVSFAASNFVPP